MGLSELDLSPCTVLTLADERVCHGLGPCGTWRTRGRRRVALAEDGRPNAVHRLALSVTGLGQWHTGFRRWSSRVQGDATSIDSVCCNEDRLRAGGTDGWACRNSICPLAPCSPWPTNVCATGSARAGRDGRRVPVGGSHWRKHAVRVRPDAWHGGALASASGTQAFAGGRVGCKGTQRGSTAPATTRIDGGGLHGWKGLPEGDCLLALCLCWPKSVCATGSARVGHGGRGAVGGGHWGKTAVHAVACTVAAPEPPWGTGLSQWHTGFRRWSSRVRGDTTRIDNVCYNEDRQWAGGTGGRIP